VNFLWTLGENNAPVLSPGIRIKFDKFFEKWILHPDPKVDLAIMPLKLVVAECRRHGKLPFYTQIQSSTVADVIQWKEFIPIEDVLLVGYPNGLWDETNNLPFFMKGITSTHPGINYKGNDEFVINMPVYLGSSGSPVFLVNKEFYDKSRNYQTGGDEVRLLGIAYKHLLYLADGKVKSDTDEKKSKVSSRILLDLGLAIRSTKLRDFEPILQKSRSEWDL
jgi:hypothetical protein